MIEAYFFAATVLLMTVAVCLVRVLRGPTRADRMMGAQLAATAGVAILALISPAGSPAMLDVALVLALLGAFAAVAFVKAATIDGAGDPEEESQ
ncbi:MAG: monovalent cation/H+ antiporter complex subunit F [Beijerinckiaceae bacterium]|nr:monovalent cation/H+ antiporter complex subunit F [Beijerinckiaceae bacterium]